MKNEELNMDKAFREKLENYSAEPPDHIWNSINGQLGLKRKKIQMSWYSLAATAAVLIIVLAAGWYFSRVLEDDTFKTADTKTESFDERSTPGEIIHSDDEINTRDDVSAGGIPVTQLASAEKESYFIDKKEKHEQTDDIQSDNELELLTKQSMQLIDNIKAVFSNSDEHVTLADRGERGSTSPFESVDKNLVAENVMLAGRNLSKKEPNWKMGLNISPGYSSYSASHGENYASNMTYSDHHGNSSVTGGFSLQYKAGKRLSIESGVSYAQNGHKSESAPQSFEVYAESDNLVPASERLYFNPEVDVADNRISMNSVAGIIDLKTVPRGAEMTANLEKADSYSTVLLTSGEFSQVFDFLEIPLYLRYLLIDSKIEVEVMGGVNTGFVVGNKAYMKNEYGEQNIGETRDISTLNFSGTLGVGLTYALSKSISLALEPRVNYYLNSINSNPDVDFRPYRVGVYTGLYYEF
jgi:opacity protein-like surface antigen